MQERFGGSLRTHDAWIAGLLEAMMETVSERESLSLRGFGVLEVREVSPHTTIDPRTGENVSHDVSFGVNFRPSRRFKAMIRASKEGGSDV